MKRLALLLLVACSKKTPSPAPSPVVEAGPSLPAPPTCDVQVETRNADVAAIPTAGVAPSVAPSVTGADACDVHRQIEDRTMTDGVVVYDEETTPLRRGEDGCEQAGPPTHRWHAVDTRTKKEWVFAADLDVRVEPKEIVAKKAGCTEIRYIR